MKSHGCFAVVAVVLALVAVPGSSSTPTAPLAVKLATLAPIGTSYHRILQEMAEKWRSAPDGGVTLRIFAGGTQGSETDTVTRMRVGQLQAAMLTVNGLAEIDTAASALQEIPMLFDSLAEQEYVREKMRPEIERRLLAKGFVTLFWGDSGWVRFFSRAEVSRPADLKPMKVFVTAGRSAETVKLMQELAFRPVAFEWSDALIQMETGGIDAVPAVPILALSSQFYRVMKHVTQVNWVPLVGALVVTRQSWDAIPPATRDALVAAAAEAGSQIQDAGRRENEQAIETMRTKLNVVVHQISPQLAKEWRVFAEGVYPKIRGAQVPADLFDQAQRLVAEYRAGPRAETR